MSGRLLFGHLCALLALFVISWSCLEFTQIAHTVVPLWLPNALLMAILLRTYKTARQCLTYFSVGGLIFLAAQIFVRGATWMAVVFTFANLVEVATAFLILRRLNLLRHIIMTTRELLGFIGVAAGIAPVLSASIAVLFLHTQEGYSSDTWLHWFSSDALGMAIVGPFAMNIGRAQFEELKNSNAWLTLLIMLLAILAVVTAAGMWHRALLFVCIPIILLSTFRLGVFGVALSTLFATIGATLLIIIPLGSPLFPEFDITHQMIVLQLFVACTVLFTFPVAAVLADNKRLTVRLSIDNAKLTSDGHAQSRIVRDLRRSLVDVEERERLRLARELHDETAQLLAAAMLDVKRISRRQNGEDADCVTRLYETLGKVSHTLHGIAWQLRSTSTIDCGLERAIKSLIDDWATCMGVKVDFCYTGLTIDELPQDVRIAAYRLVQEALTNIGKHAHATQVSVIVDCQADILHLTVEDNGCGFDAEKICSDPSIGEGGRLGLVGMRERVEQLGGFFAVQSSADVGTTVFARLPTKLANARLDEAEVETRS